MKKGGRMKISMDDARTCLIPRSIFLFLALFAMLAAGQAHAEKSAREKIKEQYFLLGLIGYNYTDRHISDYSVNGAGGFDVMLSSPTSGGSGITCCVRLRRNSVVPSRVKVRWQYDGCIYIMKNDLTGATDKVRHYYYKEAEVDVRRADSGAPEYIETHFYQDGSVQVLATDDISRPLLNLDETRVDKSSFPNCKNDEKPEE
jgi:hypothetical protein